MQKTWSLTFPLCLRLFSFYTNRETVWEKHEWIIFMNNLSMIYCFKEYIAHIWEVEVRESNGSPAEWCSAHWLIWCVIVTGLVDAWVYFIKILNSHSMTSIVSALLNHRSHLQIYNKSVCFVAFRLESRNRAKVLNIPYVSILHHMLSSILIKGNGTSATAYLLWPIEGISFLLFPHNVFATKITRSSSSGKSVPIIYSHIFTRILKTVWAFESHNTHNTNTQTHTHSHTYTHTQ